MPLKGSQTTTGWIAIGRVIGPMMCDLAWAKGTRLRRSVETLGFITLSNDPQVTRLRGMFR
jgi:hypothetical protein